MAEGYCSVLTPGRRYLSVPYAQKDMAKKRGARFDMAAKLWYVPDGYSMYAFRPWWTRKYKALVRKTNQLCKQRQVEDEWLARK